METVTTKKESSPWSLIRPGEEWRKFIGRVTALGAMMIAFGAVGTIWMGARTATYILVGSSFAFTVLWLFNRRGYPQAIVGNGLAMVGWATACLLCALSGGGIEAPAVILLPAVPAMAGFATGAKAARRWTVVIAISAIVIFVLDPYIRPSAASLETLQRLYLMGILGTTLFIGVAVIVYKRMESQHRQQLEAAVETAETALREAEAARVQAELANRAKDAFLTTMSHEIRTPLTAVMGVAEVLHCAEMEGKYARQLELLDGAGQTLLGLIDDVLDLSRIESGELEFESIDFDISTLVDEVAGVLRTHAATRGVQLITKHPDALRIQGDPLRLRQILLNLVGNAVKFTEDGEVEVRCEAASSLDDANVDLTLSVRDTGVGIAADKMKIIFQPFIQAEQGTARRFGGSGLGLSIVSRLVGRMGGLVDLDSELDRGTTVTVRLTLPRSLDQSSQRISTEAYLLTSPHVLLAEDNPVNQEVVRFMLEQCNCTVSLAHDGAEAIAAVTNANPGYDLVLMDCQMPEVDGFTATRALREQGYIVPIIALTANATPRIRARCLEAGMTGFASKPVTLNELRGLLMTNIPMQDSGRAANDGADAVSS